MPSTDDTLGQVLTHLSDIGNKLAEEDVFREDFTNFRNDYYERHTDLREAIRDLKGDIKIQKDDINGVQHDVQKVRDKLNRLEIQLEPVIEFKKMIQQQVIKYSSIGFVVLLSLTMGINFTPV
tara:strand:+ start:1097 stop:1465 length:369 start_codon:yes stop_codon:yes gene_type:complete